MVFLYKDNHQVIFLKTQAVLEFGSEKQINENLESHDSKNTSDNMTFF